MDFGLRDRVVVITGASRGLGRAFAEHFAQEGASLGLLARDEEALESLAHRLPTEVVPFKCDVTNEKQVAAAFRKVVERFGKVDSVVANVGGQSIARRAATLPVDKWREIVELNLTGSYITARESYDHLRESGSGRLVFISSGVVKLPQSGSSAYVASKAALEGLVRALCVEWASDNICVNAVLSGLVDCGAGREIDERIKNRIISSVALRRTGNASDIASMVLYLAGDVSGYMTGQTVSVDGGLALR